MNPDLQHLHPYPFQKLVQLKSGIEPPASLDHIALSIGEPKHQPPAFALQTLQDNLARLGQYPVTKGLPELRQAIASWLDQRYQLSGQMDAETQILPVNGTREALFAFAQAIVDRQQQATVLMPNPFYQIYEGAALLAGAEPYYVPCTEDTQYRPNYDDIPESVWQRCQLLYACSPGNPTGAVNDLNDWKQLLELADRYDFVIAADECYSEIYFDEQQPPLGLLDACRQLGRDDYRRCVVFNSLSKRSNLPGLRSGFVAGDAQILERFLLYRTYHGCAMPVPNQLASVSAWSDEQHVFDNRELYRQKFDQFEQCLDGAIELERPPASFFYWLKTPIADTEFCQRLFAEQHITVLPGSYLSRTAHGHNPGDNRVRMALVAPTEQCQQAAQRLKQFVQSL